MNEKQDEPGIQKQKKQAREKLKEQIQGKASELREKTNSAVFSSFQEYVLISKKIKGNLTIKEQGEESHFERSFDKLATKIAKNTNTPTSTIEKSPTGTYYIRTLKFKSGNSSVLGAGILHRDKAGRINQSYFRINFSDHQSSNTFMKWVQEQPKTAIGATLMTIFSQDGNIYHSPFPKRNSERALQDRRYANPFLKDTVIGKLNIIFPVKD